MANVHIHEFGEVNEIVDTNALAVFQAQWSTYKKLVSSGAFSHDEVGLLLHQALSKHFTRPFSFLDIACGDASLPKAALNGIGVSRYHGIDLATPAIELAAVNLANEPYTVDLDHRDFVTALAAGMQHTDAAWCGLSLHHLSTDDKRKAIGSVRESLSNDGVFFFYEPTLDEGEDLEGNLRRTRQVMMEQWVCLTPEEAAQVWRHISTCDLPELAATWLDLGRDAGFSRVSEIFMEPNRLYRMYRFDA